MLSVLFQSLCFRDSSSIWEVLIVTIFSFAKHVFQIPCHHVSTKKEAYKTDFKSGDIDVFLAQAVTCEESKGNRGETSESSKSSKKTFES